MTCTVQRKGTLTGLDISPHRGNSCAAILRKYKVALPLGGGVTGGGGDEGEGEGEDTWVVRFLVTDGTKFNLGPLEDAYKAEGEGLRVAYDSLVMRKVTSTLRDGVVAEREDSQVAGTKRRNKSMRARERKEAKKRKASDALLSSDADGGGGEGGTREGVGAEVTPTILYDRVLVDAECTHDGSIKHVAKFRASSDVDKSDTGGGKEAAGVTDSFLNEERLKEMESLQVGGDH